MHWRDGRIKQWLVARLLQWRHLHADAAVHGSYIPLACASPARLLAYQRDAKTDAAIVLAPLHVAPFVEGTTLSVAEDAFKDAVMTLPATPSGSACWKNFLTDETFAAEQPLPLAHFFKLMPFALLIPG